MTYMRTFLSALVAIACMTSALAINGKKQVDNRVPVKLAIRHADPWAVKAMLEGTPISQPEMSTIWGAAGGGTGRQGTNGQQGKTSPLLTDGFLVVNPTDNSLWWYPKKN